MDEKNEAPATVAGNNGTSGTAESTELLPAVPTFAKPAKAAKVPPTCRKCGGTKDAKDARGFPACGTCNQEEAVAVATKTKPRAKPGPKPKAKALKAKAKIKPQKPAKPTKQKPAKPTKQKKASKSKSTSVTGKFPGSLCVSLSDRLFVPLEKFRARKPKDLDEKINAQRAKDGEIPRAAIFRVALEEFFSARGVKFKKA